MKQQEQDTLEKQFSNLEMEWDSIKQSFSTSNRRSSSTVAEANHRLFRLYDNSPKELMSLLQENSPYDRAAIEVIERETDFDNGRIFGRRLFEESEVGSENDNGGKSQLSMEFSCIGSEKYGENYEKVCIDSDENGGVFDECFDMDGKSEVSTEFSCMGSEKYSKNYDKDKVCMDLLPPPSNVEVAVAEVEAEGGGGGGKSMIWVVIMLFALCIVAFKCRGQDEPILVPT